MQKISKVVSVKLCKLLVFLHYAGKEFEKVANEAKDKNIMLSIREVALETKQYKQELNAQLKSLRIKNIRSADVINKETNELLLEDNHIIPAIISDKEIIELCCKHEIYFEKAYRNILNEFFPFTALRDMLVYQLNGIKCAFMQLKLLKSVGWL